MKQLITATIAAVLLVGCGESQEPSATEAQPAEPVAEVSAQQSTPPEVQLAEPVAEVSTQQSVPPAEAEPVAEVAKPEPPTAKAPEPPSAKAPDISITQAAETGDIEAIKQH